MKEVKKNKSREIAFETLMSIEKGEDGGRADLLLKGVLEKHSYMDRRDRAFIKRLVTECIKRRIYLDHCIDCFSKTPAKKCRPAIRVIFRMGICQLYFFDGVPARAAVNESVELAVKKGFTSLKGYVNAVLRTAERSRNEIETKLPDKKKSLEKFLSIKYSVPEWIVKEFLSSFGEERTENTLAASLKERGVNVRYRGEDEAAWLDTLKESGITVLKNPLIEHVYELSGTSGMEELPGFNEGKAAVQDMSSMLAVKAAGIKSGDTVIDLCAAPGGKCCFAAELAGSEGRVYAFDISEKKTELIDENYERLGLSNIETAVGDATVFNEELAGKADVVICDLPCSGLGVMGRKADLKYRVTSADVDSLAELQFKILKNATSYVKAGGTLVFSTCTVSRRENEENVRRVLEDHDGFGLKAADIKDRLPAALAGMCEGNHVQLLTGEPADMPLMDGFFISVFTKE